MKGETMTSKLKITDSQMEAIEAAYIKATGVWTSCDWTTTHGTTELDLDGCQSDRLRYLADRLESGTISDDEYDELPSCAPACESSIWPDGYAYGPDEDDAYDTACEYAEKEWLACLISDLRSGADWLDEVASAATSAEHYADEAMRAARRDDLQAAIANIRDACSCESYYGDDPTWCELRRLIEDCERHQQR